MAIALIGAGRAGKAFANGLWDAGHEVIGPLGRDEDVPESAEVVLICVPDSAVQSVASEVAGGPLIGHCCGAHGLELLPRTPAFCLHPLMTLKGNPGELAGAFAAVDGSDEPSLEVARRLAADLDMTPVQIADGDRAAYHAAASVAS